ncbi:NACHT domain-containing protein [Flavobacterium haoranii]|uniref:NACHT domain-containing protein n=1 Tax=Flavobacterium haoranii TaxID=683124 RepID=A0A1M6J792_9FLAO|nr:NACHT domain-containing protein [Flavobacterium haoranii]SHJ42530.1 NACHT domain-containing protein [Flavobacterium haoranii]
MRKKTVKNIPDIQSLVTLVTKIAEKLGLNEIKSINQYMLSATEDSALGHRDIKILCTLSELGGKLQLILDQLKENIIPNDEIIVVSSNEKKISNYFKNWLKEELNTDKIIFWEESFLVQLVDKHLPEYWGHNDVFLKSFEDAFINNLESNGELQKALKLDKKFEELLNIFIEPKIYRFKDDDKTGRLLRIKFKKDQYLDSNNYFLSGDAGTGKTTLLKEIGKLAIEHNQNSIDKILPIRIKTSLIANTEYSIDKAIEREIENLVGKEGLDKVFDDYRVLVLIDSIDEFETEKQKGIFSELNNIVEKENLSFVIATRNYENLTKGCEICEHIHTMLSNFDLHQVQQYLDTFFKRDLKKSEELWNSLQDNKILERIPSTPLTISLVSVLFEENGYEVPATITDVYDNFNTFLLGRLNVNSNLEFLRLDVKEKILQMYALKIIQSTNRTRLKLDDFIKYVVDYFKGQSITIEEHVIPDLIKSMTDGTGVLYVDEQQFVTYQHDHFLEYYASREIFDDEDRQGLEKEIIEKFCEYNWQNTAIFYTGRTKNMKNFLDSLVVRVKKYKLLHEHLLAVSGLGYILQSLWMTHSDNRKNAVLAALDLLIRADSGVKQLAEQKFPFFRGIKDTDIAVANLAWFFIHYNSITLRDPLQLAFDELHSEMKNLQGTQFEKDKLTRLYQLFCIAATLNTGRVKDTTKLDILFEEEKLLTIPLFVYLFDEAIDILEYGNEAKMRKDYKLASKKKKYTRSIRFLLENPSENLRHTTFERLNPIKQVELFTEGKTDASIISHAFRVLTMNDEPYWSITAIENILSAKAGGAQQLSAFLMRLAEDLETDFDKSKTVIGIFDNDAKGYQEFNGLPKIFETTNGIVKKVKDMNIYAIMLPIPEQETYKAYHQEKQAFKFFEIEHYFPIEILQENNMVTQTSIPGVFEITGSKSDFNDKILRLGKKERFVNFVELFKELDQLCNKTINYIE